jgi:hypothetical protein
MRRLLFAALSAAAVVLSFGAGGPASAAQDRYCLQGRSWGYPGNCQFSTYRQCQATASGTDATCGINPAYAFARQRRGYYPRY